MDPALDIMAFMRNHRQKVLRDAGRRAYRVQHALSYRPHLADDLKAEIRLERCAA